MALFKKCGMSVGGPCAALTTFISVCLRLEAEPNPFAEHTMTDDKPKSHLVVLAGLILAAIASLAVVSFAPTKAKAQTVSTYVGGMGGYSFANTALSTGGATIVDGLGSKGFAGGIFGGVDLNLTNSPFFVGAFGDFKWQHVDFSVPAAPFSARLGDAWTVGGRIGMTTGKLKPYVLLGYTQADTSSSIAGLSMPKLKGLAYGAGFDYMLANNLAVGVEARINRYDSATIAGTGLDMQTDQLAVMARLSLQFGAMPSPVAIPPLK